LIKDARIKENNNIRNKEKLILIKDARINEINNIRIKEK